MAVRQYIGARYVPKFFEGEGGSSEWISGFEYEPLTIVTYLGNSYTSKKAVPVTIGTPNLNPEYWAATGNYNAQVEEYRQEVVEVIQEVGSVEEQIGVISGEIGALGASVDALNESVTDINADIDGIKQEATYYDNGDSPAAITDYKEGTLFYWNDTLFYATEDIVSGATIEEGVNAARFNLSDKLSGVDEEIEKLKYKDVGLRMAYYIDGVNGDNENDGLTPETPLKDLQFAYEKAYAYGYRDLTFLFLTGGRYVLDDRRITNTTIHFTNNFTEGHAEGIILQLGDGTYTPYFYNSYVNMSANSATSRIEVNAPRGIHCDGADIYCSYTHITADGGNTERTWDIANSNINISNSEIDREISIYSRGGFLKFEGTNVINWDADSPASVIRGQNTFMALFGSMTVKPLTKNVDQTTNAKWPFQIQVGVMRFEPRMNVFANGGFKFEKSFLRARNAFVTVPPNVRTDFVNTSLSGQNLPDGGASVIANVSANVYIEAPA